MNVTTCLGPVPYLRMNETSSCPLYTFMIWYLGTEIVFIWLNGQRWYVYNYTGFYIFTAVVMTNSTESQKVTGLKIETICSFKTMVTFHPYIPEDVKFTIGHTIDIKKLTTFEVPTLKQNLNSRHSSLSSRAAVTSSNRNRKIGNSSIRCSKFRATDRTLLALVMSLKLSLRERQLLR